MKDMTPEEFTRTLDKLNMEESRKSACCNKEPSSKKTEIDKLLEAFKRPDSSPSGEL